MPTKQDGAMNPEHSASLSPLTICLRNRNAYVLVSYDKWFVYHQASENIRQITV